VIIVLLGRRGVRTLKCVARHTGVGMRWTGWTVTVLSVLIGGCAATNAVIEMDPVTFQGVRTADGMRVDTLDPDLLFDEAATAWREGHPRVSAERYEKFLMLFPSHRHAPHARFNAGLAREALEEWEMARGHFEAYLAGAKGRGDRLDGLFRLASCQEALQDWMALAESSQTLIDSEMDPPETARAWVLRGLSHHHQGELAAGEDAFLAALDLHHTGRHLHRFGPEVRVALAQYMIGEIYRALFEEVPLKMPLERMRQDLEDKSEFLLKAQHAYLKTVRIRDREWSLAAGFRIGEVYERFYGDLIAAEVPAELDAQDVALYFEELREQIQPVLRRAISVYERNLRLSERSRARDGEWARRTQEHLTRLRELLKQEDERMRRKREAEGSPPSS